MTETQTKAMNSYWKINTDSFGQASSPFGDPNKKERKFNFKIRLQDLALLDELAAHYQITRSTLINFLLAQGFAHQLTPVNLSTDPSDLEVKLLIANRADEKLQKIGFQRQASWVEDVLSEHTDHEYQKIMDSEEIFFSGTKVVETDSHSDKFIALNNFFNELDNK